jgi:hypothetical protein
MWLNQYSDWSVGSMTVVRFPEEAQIFLPRCLQRGFGAHQASYSVGTAVPLPGGKVARVYHSPPSSAAVRNVSCPFLHVSVTWGLTL